MEVETDDCTVSRCSKEIAHKISIGEYVLRTTSSKSRVWTVFAKIEDQNGWEIAGYVGCRVCGKVLKFHKTSCTSNLVKHRCYAINYVLNAENQVSRLETANLSFDSNFESNYITKLITKCLIKNFKSYELIQSHELKTVFQEFVALGAKFGTIIDVGHLLPSTKTVARNVNEIYQNCFERVKAEIALIKENGFGLAINIWENNCFKMSYIALTIHFIQNGVITCRLLGLRTMRGEIYTSQNIHEKAEHILKDFDCKLSSKSIIVTNGCSEIMKSQTLPCITNLLNNALQKSIEEVPTAAELISSSLKLANFLNRQENTIFAELLQGYRFCSSRWITMYKILDVLTVHWAKIDDILRGEEEETLQKNINLNHLRAVVKILEPFEEAIETLEKDDKATLHLVVVYLHDLKKTCDSTNDSKLEGFNFIKVLKKKLRLNLEKIDTESLTIFHKLALFLFPPTKKLLQFSDKEKECIESECIRLMKCFKDELKPIIKQESDCTYTPLSKRKRLFSDFIDHATNNDDPNVFIIEELQIYKMTRVVDSDEFEVFSWWELQKDNFPHLYKLSRTVLVTPASTASAQRIFISSGSMFCDEIRATSDMDIEHIAFLKFNAEEEELDFEI